MKLYFDESGSFRISPWKYEHRVAVVSGIAIPESAEDDLAAAYSSFLKSLSQNECVNGEPKGNLLSASSQRRFCEMLLGIRGLLFVPHVLDLSIAFERKLDHLPRDMRYILLNGVESITDENKRRRREIFANQFGNLSAEQAIRIYSWAVAVHQTLSMAILFRSTGWLEKSWEDVRIIIDRVRSGGGNREETAFLGMLRIWMGHWSPTHPITLVNEWHTPNHTIRRLYEVDKGIDMERMIGGKVSWKQSKNEPGLQIADITANILYRAAKSLTNEEDAMSNFVLLMRASCYGYKLGPGLIRPQGDLPPAVLAKYWPLHEAMKIDSDRRAERKREW